MNKIEGQYKSYAVKILSKENEGSGCLFQLNNEDYCYVLTAKHCLLNNDGALDKQEIQIFRYNDRETKLKVHETLIDEELDIAVLVVEKVSPRHTQLIGLPLKNEKAEIYGYPFQLASSYETRENIQCNISFCHDLNFELTTEHSLFTFNTSTGNNVKGLSGAGVFIEKDGILNLVGIFTELKGNDGAYNKLNAFNLGAFNNLLRRNGYPTLDKNDTSKINTDNNLLRKVFYLPYELESEPYYLQRTIDNNLENLFLTPKHIWISGLSGVGKTNLIFRNLKINHRPFLFFDLSTLQEKNIEDYFKYIDSEVVEQCELSSPVAKGNIYEQLTLNLKKIEIEGKNIILFVDEVPISDETKFFQFLNGFITVSERFLNQTNNSIIVKWIISTRINPSGHLVHCESLLANKTKANKNFNFKHLGIWGNDDLNKLLVLLETSLNFKLDEATTQKVIKITKGFPGRLKDIIERMITERCSIHHALELIQAENY